MGKQITNHTHVNAVSHGHIVKAVSAISHIVTSGSSGDVYEVKRLPLYDEAYECNCHWGSSKPGNDRRSMCSHVVAVVRSVAEEKGFDIQIMSEDEAWHKDAQYYGDGTYVLHDAAQSFEEFLENMKPQWADEDYDQGDDLLFMKPGTAGMSDTTSKSW